MKFSQVLLLLIAFVFFSASPLDKEDDWRNISEGDISLFGPEISPTPLRPPAEGGSGDLCFVVSNSIGSYAQGLVTLQINLSNMAASQGVADLSTTGNVSTSRWDWSYNESTATFTGVQSGAISGDYWEQICIDVAVTGTSPQSNKDNGFQALVLVDEDAGNISTENDEVNIYTYTQSVPCPDSLLVDGTISSLEFLAEQKIESDAIVVPGGEVIFDAGECIILKSGFSVTENALFEVKTDGCIN